MCAAAAELQPRGILLLGAPPQDAEALQGWPVRCAAAAGAGAALAGWLAAVPHGR